MELKKISKNPKRTLLVSDQRSDCSVGRGPNSHGLRNSHGLLSESTDGLAQWGIVDAKENALGLLVSRKYALIVDYQATYVLIIILIY